MAENFNPPIAPSPGSRRKPELALLKASFGDGFSQIAANGINHRRDVLELIWEVLTTAQANEIVSFLEARGGFEPFYYARPGTLTGVLYTCDTWEETFVRGGYRQLTATFKQCFAWD